jgi:hypothetical protein
MAEIRSHLKSRLKSPYHIPLEVTVSGLRLEMQDSPFESFNIRFQRLAREYLATTKNYSQVEIIKEIDRRKGLVYPLVSLTCADIKLSLSGHPSASTFQTLQAYLLKFTPSFNGK